MPIDTRQLRISVAKKAEKTLVREVRQLVQLDFDTKKDIFLHEFEANEVTQELRAGPEGSSSDQRISNTGGNLFSLIGFEASDRPADELKEYLDESIRLGRTAAGKVRGNSVSFSTPVRIPTINEVDSAMATKVPLWSGRAFTSMIAKGVTGLPRYLFDLNKRFATSHSGTAIQVKKDLNDSPERSTPRSYIKDVLDVFKRLTTRRR